MKNTLKLHIIDYLNQNFNIDLSSEEHNQSVLLIQDDEIFLTLHNLAQDILPIVEGLQTFVSSNYPDYKLYMNFTKPVEKELSYKKPTAKQLEALKIKLPHIKYIIPISSGKGGVGKSTATIHLAYAMAHLGYRVGILDGDIYGPSIKFMMGDSKTIIDDNCIKTFIKDGIVFNSIAIFMDKEDDAIVLKAPIILKIFNQLMQESKWGVLDFLFIDLPPGTGDLHINLALKYAIAGSVVICTPQRLAMIDAIKAIGMWEKTQVKVLGLIENMSSFVCENCNHTTHIFDSNHLEELGKEKNINYLGNIPLDVKIRHYCDNQTNVIKEDPTSLISQEFIKIAQTIIQNLKKV